MCVCVSLSFPVVNSGFHTWLERRCGHGAVDVHMYVRDSCVISSAAGRFGEVFIDLASQWLSYADGVD